MIDDTPYIIVDNQKIAPLGRVPNSGLATAEAPHDQDQPFGVVDRVSISRQAIQKYRQLQATLEAESPPMRSPSPKFRTKVVPLLTDPPK